MSQDNSAGDSFGRRGLLKTLGGTAVGIASVGRVTAVTGRDVDRIYQTALELRERTNNHSVFVQYLERHGANVWTEHRDISFPLNGSEDVGTNKLDKGSLSTDLTLTYMYNCGELMSVYADYNFSISGAGGEPGADEITLTWNDDHYRVVDYEWYNGGGSELNYKASELNGVNWEWTDDGCGSGIYNCNYSSYVGTEITPLATNQTRAVRGEYRHTWENVEFSGFGVKSGGGVSWGYTPTEYFWEWGYRTETEDDANESYDCYQ